LTQIEQLQRSIRTLNAKSSAEAIEAVHKDVTNLHETIKNWLRLEAFIQRGYRAQYIVNFLGQVEAMLSYASHKVHCLASTSVAGTTAPAAVSN
jgi:hypothetical protein